MVELALVFCPPLGLLGENLLGEYPTRDMLAEFAIVIGKEVLNPLLLPPPTF